jgi:hypothetical protein
MTKYRIVPCGTTPETWVIERVANYLGHSDPLMIFDTFAEAEDVLAIVLARKALSES